MAEAQRIEAGGQCERKLTLATCLFVILQCRMVKASSL